MKKIAILFCTLLLIALIPPPLNADRGINGMGAGPRYGQALDRWMSETLNLTAEQIMAIRSLRQQHLEKMEPFHKKLYMKRRELRNLWLQHPPDHHRISAVDEEIHILRHQMDDQMTGHHQAILKLLTPEQQVKFQSYSPGHGRGAGMGRRMGMRGY